MNIGFCVGTSLWAIPDRFPIWDPCPFDIVTLALTLFASQLALAPSSLRPKFGNQRQPWAARCLPMPLTLFSACAHVRGSAMASRQESCRGHLLAQGSNGARRLRCMSLRFLKTARRSTRRSKPALPEFAFWQIGFRMPMLSSCANV